MSITIEQISQLLDAKATAQTNQLIAQTADIKSEIKSFIDEAIGTITTRVDAIENDVSRIQKQVDEIAERQNNNKIKGEEMVSLDLLTILPSLYTRCRKGGISQCFSYQRFEGDSSNS